MTILSTERLTKRYGSTVALDRLDLTLDDGGIFGFLGPNGSGKTTTIRLLLGLLRPTDGKARILGRDCWRESAVLKREVGYLPGDVRLYPTLNGRQLLGIFGRVRRRDLLRPGAALAGTFDLDLELEVSAMSRGTRQKLGLVLALVHEPRLVVLDEPTVSLDPITQRLLKDHLRAMASRGHTVFFSSHSLSEVEQLCRRVAILRRGRVVVDTTLEELRKRACRVVSIAWRKDPETFPETAPRGLEVMGHAGGRWRCRLRGSVAPVVRWLASPSSPPLGDVTISPPDLESLFHEYYRE